MHPGVRSSWSFLATHLDTAHIDPFAGHPPHSTPPGQALEVRGEYPHARYN